MSYGCSVAGYDIRIATPMNLKPGQFELGVSIERFNLPDNVIGFVHDKSSWARKGLSLFNTVIEPGWVGYLTLELIHHGVYPIDIQYGDPIAQIIFMYTDTNTEGYSGKYQDQPPVPVGSIYEKAA